MMIIKNTSPARRTVGIAAVLLGIAAPAAYSDDIELFVSTNNQPFQCEAPNVVFLIDTSGSMDGDVTTQAEWNPNETYSGCFSTGDYYYNATGTPPDCAATASFAKTSNRCSALSGTEYTGEFQAWDASAERWVKISESTSDWTTECKADKGLHGDGIGSANFAVDGSEGPWSENGDNQVAWGSNASAVTVFDGNWLNWLQNPPTVTKTRLQIVQEVTKATLANIENINVALMTFNSDNGGSMLHAMEAIGTAREPLSSVIDGLGTGGSTPLSESLYELGQYLRGGLIQFGTSPNGESVAESRLGGTLTSDTYLSPLNSSGQNSYIVLLTDGEPSNDSKSNRQIEALPEYGQLVGDICDDNVDGSCLDSMAEYLYKADLRDDVPGQQNVITHTIGFQIDLPLLASTAERGGGKYFVADNTASLTSVLSNLAKDFSRSSSLLAPPQIPINSFNSADRLDDVYVSVFQPEATQHWPGNVKRYRLRETGNVTVLVDANGNNVIDPATGTFSDSAVSFWSNPELDGGQADLGGAASQLPSSATRKLLSNVGGGTGLSEVTTANMNITGAMLGAPDSERDKTIRWARGIDVRDEDEDGDVLEDRKSMGDPLHVQPVTVAYGSDEANSNALVFVSTNDGYLHAIDATDGMEVWSFIPRRLLPRLFELSLAQPSTNKEYGLDGELRVVTAGGRKVLIFGMRRGGDAMFAMDITSRSNPSLLWVIDSNTSQFLDLGQTWSPATVARVSIGGAAKDVILFGGGYDAGQDNGAFRTDSKGNAIYMVNTLTGALEWSAGSDNGRNSHDLPLDRMDFSIPAGLRVLDSNRDGFADRIYAGDMGAQVWRIDIINGNGRASLAEGGVIASLGAADDGAPARANARRFYNTPDAVDLVLDAKILTAINIGSGYRAHPLDATTDEEFYSIRDFRTQEVIPTGDYGTPAAPILTRADLLDVTDNTAPTLLATDPGWRLRLDTPGEKILGSSLTISNILFFNSFTPAANLNSCLPGGGQNRLYRVNVLKAAPLTNLDFSVDPDNLTKEDRYVNVGRQQDVPLVVMPGPGGPCSGIDCFDGENELTGTTDGDGDGGDDPDPRGGESGPQGTYWFPVTRP